MGVSGSGGSLEVLSVLLYADDMVLLTQQGGAGGYAARDGQSCC